MGMQTSAPINEAVFLIKKNDPNELKKLRSQFPQLGRALDGGLEGGKVIDDLDRDRALVMISALVIAAKKAREELVLVKNRMVKSKQRRLGAEIVTLVGGSGVLAGLAINQPTVTLVTAILTLIASLGNLLADRSEALVKPGTSNIYDAYDKSSLCAYKAEALIIELELLVKHNASKEKLRQATSTANALCQDLNKWISEMEGSRPVENKLPNSVLLNRS